MFHSILVPLDGTSFAEHALSAAVKLAELCKAQLHLVKVQVPVVVGDNLAQYTVLDVDTRPEVQSYLDGIARGLADRGIHHVRTAVLEGSILDALDAYIKEEKIELIVLTTHGRGTFAKLWLGSITDELIRKEHIPILVIHAPEQK